MVPKLSLRHRDYVSPFGSHAYLCCSKTFLVGMKTNFKHNFHTFATIIKKGLKKSVRVTRIYCLYKRHKTREKSVI